MARLRRITGRLAGAGALAVAGVVTFAGVASAHGHTDKVTCSSLSVDLENYQDATNSVVVTIGGTTEVNNQNFGKSFTQTFQVPADHAKPIDYEVKVVAGDDANPGPDDHKGWTFDEKGLIPICPESPSPSPSKTSPSPTPSHSQSPSPTPTTPAPTTPAPQTTAAVVATPTPSPSSTGKSLAFTGGGSNAGMIAGVGAGVVVVGGGLVFLGRRRAAAGRHN
jgi:cell division septation protein DedD